MQRIIWLGLGLLWLVSVSGLAAELVDCPARNTDDESVYLQSGENKCVKLEVKLAKRSETIKDLIEDAGVEGPIPLPNLSNQTLLDVTNILERTKEESSNDTAQKAIVQVVSKDNPARLKRLLIASNYLDIPAVLQGCISLYADKILREDLGKLRTWNENAYKDYKTAFFKDVPKDIQRLIAQRHLRFLVELATLQHDGPVLAVAFGPEGRMLTGSGDKTARLWDRGGNLIATLQHAAPVWSVAFGPEGRMLTGSDDDTAKIWDQNGQELATLQHRNKVRSVAFGPEGRMMTGSDDKTAKVWRIWDVKKLTNPLAEAQIILFVQQNKLTEAQTPEHLVEELSEYAKTNLWGE